MWVFSYVGLTCCTIGTCFDYAFLHTCSAFKRFHQLYQDYVPTGTEEAQLHSVLSPDGRIDPEVCLPMEYICEHLPELKV